MNITKLLLIIIAIIFISLFIIIPIASIFYEALANGIDYYISAISNEGARKSIKLTLLVCAISVPLNVVFGVCAAWCIAKFEFFGKKFLTTLIELPFSVSPVISGLIYIIIFSSHSIIGEWLIAHDIEIIFAVPSLVIATIFVTFPFVAKELIPLMEEHSNSEEEASTILGASGWKTFTKITLPNIKWGVLYGVILCNARAMGEFGAVSVVSGHIRGLTDTAPLHVEMLYNEYNSVAAFALASVLTLLALLTIFLKAIIEKKIK
jgi:sulfate transport system permease protein